MKRIIPIAFIIFFCTTTTWALSVPLNGGFEQADMKQAPNWQTSGPWRFKGGARLEGKRSAAIRTYDALPGDRLVAESGLLVGPNQTVTLRGHHTGEAGKIAGLELVSQRGTVIESVASDDLGAADEWVEFTVTYQAPAEIDTEQRLYVRPYVEVIQQGVRFAVDNLSFGDQPPTDEAEKIEVPRLEKPDEKADSREEGPQASSEPEPEPESEKETGPDPNYPNLIRNPRLSGLSTPQFWSTIGSEERTSYQPPSSGQTGSISITSGEPLAGWSTEIRAMDISVPHQVEMQTSYSETPQRPVQLVVLVLDYSRTKVYHHSLIEIPADSQHFETTLPSFNRLPVKGVTQLTLLADEKMNADFSLSNPAVKVDPHIPRIRPLESLALFPKASDVGFFMQIPNHTNQTRPFLTHLKTVNPDGIGIGYDKRRMQVGPRAVAYFPYKPTVKGEGRYKLVLRVQNADGSHTYKYSEYPFVVSSIDKNPDNSSSHIGVRVTGTDDNEIRAAAMAGASWICMDLEYTDLLASYDFRSRLREVTNSAYRAKSKGLKVAVRVKMVGEPGKIVPDARKQFAEDITRQLYGGVDRWIIDAPSGNDGRVAGRMAATILETGQEDIPAMVPCGNGYRLFEPGVDPEEVMDEFMSELEDLAPGENADRVGGSEGTDVEPGSTPEADISEPPADPEEPSEADTAETQAPEAEAPQKEASETPSWVFSPDPTDNAAAPALMSRQITRALDYGAEVVFWKSAKTAALVDDDGYATEAWLELRRIVSDLEEPE